MTESIPPDRIPAGGLAEVLDSEEGPALGAVFDLDGTLVAGYTALVFAEDRCRRGQVGLGEAARTVALGALGLAGRATFADLIALGASTWKGRPLEEVEDLAQRLFDARIADRIYPEVRELVRAHQRKGHTVVMASSATVFQVAPAARDLGIGHVLCSQLEVSAEGVLTGGVLEPMMWGPGKAAAVQRFAATHGVDLARSWFYSDGDEDEVLMRLVGRPRPTNPRPGLAAVAGREGWPVQRFSSRGGRGIGSVARNLVGFSALPAVGAVSVAAGLLNRDRRLAIDLTLTHSIDLLLAVSGVSISAVGAEHLVSHRPAVFIWNHRNNFDALIVAKLVGGRFTGVGRDRRFGTVGRLCDLLFVDQDGADHAASALDEGAERARRGISVLVAPEGTRSPTGELGPFQEGAFRIAMAAGVPVVPVVVRNAAVLGPRNATFMRPGTVDVVALAPIDVRRWRVSSLGARIEEVQQLFADTLAAWPGTYS